MTLPVARDLSREGIRVNTILPGLFDTPLFYLGVWALKPKVHEDPEEVWDYKRFAEEAI